MSNLPELPIGAACLKSSEWEDARERRQSFNGWRIRYGDCDMDLFTADQLQAFAQEAVKQEREAILAGLETNDAYPGNDWGAGYVQANRDIAAGIRFRQQGD